MHARMPLWWCADHEARDVLDEEQGDFSFCAQLDEVRTLDGRLGKQNAIVGHDACTPTHIGEDGYIH